MSEEVVTRLGRAIVEELRRRGEAAGPITVSELYRDIVPYARVRDTLGVALAADYEHALLRLLSGERGLLQLEPETARRELRSEVADPFPAVGAFRKFADCQVRVRPAGADLELDESEEDDRAREDDLPDRDRTRPGGPDRADACAFCGHALPEGHDVRFCPGCGGDQRRRPCPACGLALEEEWRFCVRCGRERDA